jgi:hypothetical protein
MNIEIHNPELEQRVRQQIQRGQFHNMDDLLEKALDALEEKETAAAPLAKYETAAAGSSGMLACCARWIPADGLAFLVLTIGLIRPHSLDSTVGFVLASKTPS